MQSDPLYLHLEPFIASHPLQAGPLLSSFRDLALSIQWHDLRVIPLTSEWIIILGHKSRTDPLRAVLPLPLHTTSLKPSSLRQIFSSLSNLESSSIPDPIPPLVPSLETLQKHLRPSTAEYSVSDLGSPQQTAETRQFGKVADQGESPETATHKDLDKDMIYLAITTTDSTVVYYKLTRGIKKPADIPDE
ncbi:hypothetical protein TREMEDRAFT_42833 [Tremella mesenterica DSM 1558]|uniref:uncharacterized protein n=1 Tax=Tremella mesenterica (strain ATCC 24925 / CBS 8224 / DSM 1558 / NBRC 9311 / NRRL Y-6157 / RJB 2259-6 / UBC 559-6) TaxID=578456 RepID=UPI0003F4A259|nr:uncharacterized protein TREMEDRAFT_42833 [Tremella mesenterica DSM 1558]EIW71450.1 hypothetical protein TREMEDRAFT_42833 [Tremella mesenterica DSM 1558]